jgi:carboxypeptidase family protein
MTVIMKALILLCCVTAAIVLTPRNGMAGSQKKVKLKGVLLDPQDARIVHATVTLENDKLKRQVYSNEEGVYEVQLPAGVYRLTVESHGFKELQITMLQVDTDDADDLTIHLEPQRTGPHGYFDFPIRIEPKNSPLPEKIKPRKIQ